MTVAVLETHDINAVNRNGDTALHAAALMGYDGVVSLLAGKGANLNVKNSRGLTPLATLTGRGGSQRSVSTVDLLRKLGALE